MSTTTVDGERVAEPPAEDVKPFAKDPQFSPPSELGDGDNSNPATDTSSVTAGSDLGPPPLQLAETDDAAGDASEPTSGLYAYLHSASQLSTAPAVDVETIADGNHTLLREDVWLVAVHASWSAQSRRFLTSVWPEAVARIAANESLLFYRSSDNGGGVGERANEREMEESDMPWEGAGSRPMTLEELAAASAPIELDGKPPDLGTGEALDRGAVNGEPDEAEGVAAAAHGRDRVKYRFAVLDAHASPRAAALLEVTMYPCVKLVQRGYVWTMRDNYTRADGIVDFVTDGWRAQAWYNRLPATWSFWFKIQLELYNILSYQWVALDERFRDYNPHLGSFVAWVITTVLLLVTTLGPFLVASGLEGLLGRGVGQRDGGDRDDLARRLRRLRRLRRHVRQQQQQQQQQEQEQEQQARLGQEE